jgi:hypothetical protein
MINTEEIKKLVLTRLEAMPDTIRVSIGTEGKELAKNDLIEHVKKEDSLGKMIIEMQLRYLQALKTGL